MEEPKSKSQKKREAHALQQLGLELTQLSAEQLKQFELPDLLVQAIDEAKSINSNSAKRRHAQFIGRIMRDIDVEPIQEQLDKIKQGSAKSNAQFHLAERWRERLISEGKEALTEFLAAFPCDDIQQLRHLITQARKEREKNNNLGSYKALFRHIKAIIS